LRSLPLLVGADRLLRAGRELDAHLLEAEALVELIDSGADRVDLVSYLVERAVDVRVVLGEGTDSEQAVKDALALISGAEAELRQPQGQLAVRMPPGGEDQAGPGAVHRLERVLALLTRLPLRGGGEEHVLLVVVPVARAVPELDVEHLRGLDLLV